MAIRPSFLTIWSKFIEIYGDGTITSVGEKIGGKVEQNIKLGLTNPDAGFTNACAIRMSYALNYSGVTITRGSWATVSGTDKKWYIYRVRDLRRFLVSSFGEPDVVKTTPASSDFAKLKGIIIFSVAGWSDATGHASIWDGDKCSDTCHFPLSTEVSLWTLE